jgi:hypothetical protein
VAGCCKLAEEQDCSLLEVRSRRLLVGYRLVGTKYEYVPHGLRVRAVQGDCLTKPSHITSHKSEDIEYNAAAA